MRKKLQKLHKRGTFRFIASYERRGNSGNRKSILFQDLALVTNPEEVLCDHIWVPAAREIPNCKPGTRVIFNAKIREYVKGKPGEGMGREKDYSLSKPMKITIVP